jgi:hypothetical protein
MRVRAPSSPDVAKFRIATQGSFYRSYEPGRAIISERPLRYHRALFAHVWIVGGRPFIPGEWSENLRAPVACRGLT